MTRNARTTTMKTEPTPEEVVDQLFADAYNQRGRTNLHRREVVCAVRAAVAAKDEEIRRLRNALNTIAGGHTDRFPGAPDVMSATFRAEMWTWSQKVARAALGES